MSQVDQHWRTFQRRPHARLKQAGTLAQELRAAAELTFKEISDTQAGGMTPDEAWMATRGKYLISGEEPNLTALHEHMMDCPMHDLIREKNRLLDEMARDDD